MNNNFTVEQINNNYINIKNKKCFMIMFENTETNIVFANNLPEAIQLTLFYNESIKDENKELFIKAIDAMTSYYELITLYNTLVTDEDWMIACIGEISDLHVQNLTTVTVIE